MAEIRNPMTGISSTTSIPKPPMSDDAMRSLFYVLSGLGAAIGGEGSVGAAIGGMTQQAIQAQSYKNLLMELLKSGGKMSIDSKGVRMQAPLELAGINKNLESLANVASALKEQGSQLPQSRIGYPTDRGMLPQTSQTPAATGGQQGIGPFSTSPLVDPALTGLTLRDISAAFGIAQAQEELKQRQVKTILEEIQQAKAADLAERKFFLDVIKAGTEQKPNSLKEYEIAQRNGYTGSYIDFLRLDKSGKPNSLKEYEAALENGYTGSYVDFLSLDKSGKPNSLKEYEAAKQNGFTGSYADFLLRNKNDKPNSLKEYEAALERGYTKSYIDFLLLGKVEKPASIQEYEYAKNQGFNGTFADFKNIFGTAAISNYKYAKDQGYLGTFEDWQREMAKAAATTINLGPEERATATSRGHQRTYFEGPELREDAIKNLGIDYEFAETPQEKQKLLYTEIDNLIKQSPRFNNPVFGKRDGVIGWYDKGGEGELIRAWSE